MLEGAIEPGTRLGPVTVGAKIGQGAHAVVYRAHFDTGNGMIEGAAKIIAIPAQTLIRAELNRLQYESAILRRNSTPHLPRCFDYREVVVGELRYGVLFMEEIVGVTLREVVTWHRTHERYPSIRVLTALTHVVLDGLHHLHNVLEVYWQDLKPENIMLTRQGRVVLLDFELSKTRQQAEAHKEDGLARGTPAYMSPIQMAGQAPNAWDDLWALVMTLLELRNNRRAMEGKDLQTLINNVSRGRLARPQQDFAYLGCLYWALKAVIEGERVRTVAEFRALLPPATCYGPATLRRFAKEIVDRIASARKEA